MAGVSDKAIDKVYNLGEEYVTRKWRTGIALLLLEGLAIYLYFKLGRDLVKTYDQELADYYLPVGLLLLVAIVWFCARYRYQMMPNKRKIGIVIDGEKYAATKVKDIIDPVIAEISEEIGEVKLILLPHSTFKTEVGGIKFLKKNDYGLEEALFIRANVGKVLNDDKFVVDEAFFCVNRAPSNIKLFDVALASIAKDSTKILRSKTFPMSDEIPGTKDLRLSIKDTIFYYVGLSAIFHENIDLALLILKKLFSSEGSDSGTETNEEAAEEASRIQKNKRLLSSSSLVSLLSGLCQINLMRYRKEGRNPKMIIAFLTEYATLLQGHNDAFNIYLALARYSYEDGNEHGARHYTSLMQKIDAKSPMVFLNMGFFAMIERDAASLALNYKNLADYLESRIRASRSVAYEPLDIIEFLYNQEVKYPENVTFLRYGVAIHYLYLVDYEKGVGMLTDIKSRSEENSELNALSNNITRVLKSAALINSSVKRAPKATTTLLKVA